ncbi:hypothetical protein TUMSATVNIG1_60590 (plasmid) [Vibrio nigripulchritudo]|uniref:hypothetical protein n=1 Tax=Vibrio nigripulchritudo TaxID=28173 RepID=UPI00190D87F7|nr:hypothetical protein [Vibrio nigripulchritudo]BCL74074.1 hypothetical protein VNTUMSATTG_60110 [Vibrio nigripulchritudo]BDU35450.1 hypothetical protein TUMSATVNIG1_60590 [Vibrio nigripulchritudo]
MKHLIILLIILGAFLNVSHATQQRNWEFTIPLNEVGDPVLDRSIIISMWDTSKYSLDEMEVQVQQIAELAGMDYSGMEELRERLVSDIKGLYIYDLKHFKRHQLKNFKKTKYLDDKEHDSYILFSHKLNKPVTGMTYSYYDDYKSLSEIKIKREYFGTDRENDHTLYRDQFAERFDISRKHRIPKRFNECHGIKLSNSTGILFNQVSGDLYSLNKINSKITLSHINTNNYSCRPKFTIEKVIY